MKKMVSIVVILVSLALLGGCGAGNNPPSQEPVKSAENQDPAKITETQEKTEAGSAGYVTESPLPGVVLAMVDNYYQARPQSGLDHADQVYEIMAEGGITRFMALFYLEGAPKIGPIRSARYYFVQLARGYDAPLAHAGGSEEALEMVVKVGLKDLDEIYNAGGYFWRDAKRKMPHNLFTSTDLLLQGAKAKGYSLVGPPSFTRVEVVEGENHTELAVDYSAGTYKYVVNWRFDGKEYKRSINGKPHTMEEGAVIKAENIIVMTATTRNIVKNKTPLSEIDFIGKGETRYFSGGKMTKGKWSKESAQGKIRFMDEKGNDVKLLPGKVWLQVIPHWDSLTVK